MRTPDEEKWAALARVALAKLGPQHPRERLNIPPMIKGQDIEVPLFTLNETLLAFQKNTRS